MEPVTPSAALPKSSSHSARPVWRQILANSNSGLLIAYLVLVFVFTLVSPIFLSLPNIINIAQTIAIVGVLSAGETLVIINGGFDLSVGSVAALTAVVIGFLYSSQILPIWPATLLGILAGALVGLVNGLVVTRLRVNAIITTLGTMSIARGMAFVLSSGQTNQLNVESFIYIGRGMVASVPVPLVIMLVIYILIFVVMQHTPFGRNIYAVGGSADAARLAGIDVDRVRVQVYLISGVFAALGGVILSAQLASSFPNAATGLELTAIAAVVLGGSSLGGGTGGILGTLLGVFVLRTLDNGLIIANVSSYYQDVARGLVLLIAVGFDQLRKRRIWWK